jgi:hypothetical protein
LIDAALLRMLPVEKPEQLVEFKATNPAFPVTDAFSYPTLQDLKGQTQVLAGVFAFRKLTGLTLRWTAAADWQRGNWFRAITSQC